MIPIAYLQKLWRGLIRFPWPTITFLAVLLFGWEKLDHIADNREKSQTIKESHAEVTQQYRERMSEGKELRQQVIESQGRLLDILTKRKYDTTR